LGRRAGFTWEDAGGDADVALEGARGLVRDAGDIRLPAEAAHAHCAGHGVPDPVRPALDGARRSGLLLGIAQDLCLGDGIEQADTGDLRCDARADPHVGGHRAVGQVLEAVARALQRVRRAVVEAALHRLGAQAHAALGPHAVDRGVVELVAVDRLRAHATMRADTGHRQAHQQRHRGLAGAGGAPRPSCTWQPPQERAMKCGPRPSRARVEAGACTQLRRKKELPTAKRAASASDSVASGNEKAVRPVAKTVPVPARKFAELIVSLAGLQGRARGHQRHGDGAGAGAAQARAGHGIRAPHGVTAAWPGSAG
jgi:hypothetical protein